MKTEISKHLYLYLFMVIFGISMSSCKKDHSNKPEPPATPTALSDADSLKYLMYQIMQVSFVDGGRDTTYDLPTYYWYKEIPKLDPLSKNYDSADVLLASMKTYAINPSNEKAYDKYSFLDHGEVQGEIQQGVSSGDLGIQVSYAGDGTPSNTTLYVLFSDKNSPAGQAGVTRGWQITGIDGNSVEYDGRNGANVNNVINKVYNDPNPVSFTFKKPDGTTQTIKLSKAVYNINPVLFDTIYSVNAKKVGYFVFNSFAAVENSSGPTLTKQELARVFNKFQSAGISSLIVDLRYNGGGSVGTAEYLDNMIAPASVQGKEMYHYLYNDKLTAQVAQQPDFLSQKVLFNGGSGNLNLDQVFFIGSSHTASASELTINNLKPYMSVKLVGQTTYGKPVGFFTFHISDFPNGGAEKDLADLYAINFETRNSINEGGYFNGMVPNSLARDFVDVPWGDNTNDENLSQIFHYISTGSYARLAIAERIDSKQSLKSSIPATIRPLRFNGMVDYRISNEIKHVVNKNLRKLNK
ncbi:MAG: S41 family peptidase [Ginsengibacter sp.]